MDEEGLKYYVSKHPCSEPEVNHNARYSRLEGLAGDRPLAIRGRARSKICQVDDFKHGLGTL